MTILKLMKTRNIKINPAGRSRRGIKLYCMQILCKRTEKCTPWEHLAPILWNNSQTLSTLMFRYWNQWWDLWPTWDLQRVRAAAESEINLHPKRWYHSAMIIIALGSASELWFSVTVRWAQTLCALNHMVPPPQVECTLSKRCSR